MDDEIKVRFDELDKRLVSAEKRFDDIKWYFGGVTGVFMIVFSLLTVILSWNYKAERDSLREFQKDIKAELGKVESPPELEILGTNGLPLANQEIEATFEKEEDGHFVMQINLTIRNIGDSLSGPLYTKIYSSNPINFLFKSTDEPKFQYEFYIDPKNMPLIELPGRYSTEITYNLRLKHKTIPPNGKYPAMIKIFFGKGKISRANFTLVIAQK
ncbi:MAG: hypothetical protein WC600_16365 [Desulfobaccales bacterium]